MDKVTGMMMEIGMILKRYNMDFIINYDDEKIEIEYKEKGSE